MGFRRAEFAGLSEFAELAEFVDFAEFVEFAEFAGFDSVAGFASFAELVPTTFSHGFVRACGFASSWRSCLSYDAP